MNTNATKRLTARTLVAALAASALLWMALAGAHAAGAGDVTAAGSAAGTFADATGASTGSSLKGLSYYRSDFNATTANGSAALNGAAYSPSASNAPNSNNLGSFYLATPAAGTNDVYTGSTFNLQVTFNAPGAIDGGQQSVFTSQLTGAVVRTTAGSSYSIGVDFDNTPKVFTYKKADGSTAAFALIVNDVNGITPNLAKPITGTVVTASANATSGAINSSNTPSNPLVYTAGPFYVANASGAAGLQCNAALQCNDFRLHVDLPTGLVDSKQVRVAVSWPLSNADFDISAYAQNADGTAGQQVNSSDTSADPEVMILPAVSGDYVIRVVPFNPLGQTITATIWVEDKANNFTAGTGTAPQFTNYAAPGGLGTSSGEPSIGYDPKTNTVMFQASLQTLKVKFDDSQRPARATWEDKSFLWTSAASLDPILFTDQKTGRTIVSQLAGTDSFSAFTDSDGDSWTPTEGGPMTSGVDHQTVGAGPYAAPIPQGVNPVYPNAVYYCSQDLYTAFCARSDDGGLTFGPTVPMYTTECGGIHGHVKVAPDGTVYVPNRQCGTNQGIAISDDNGITWRVSKIVDNDPTTSSGDSIPGNWDPSVGIGAGNTVYVGYDNGDGRPHAAVSKDRGHSWVLDQNVGRDLNIRDTAFPAVVAGDDNRAAFAFLGAQTSPGSNDAVWHLYISTTYDGGNSWITADATPNDPVQLGTICAGGISCSGGDRNLLDFIDATVDSQGRTLVGYADGCIGCSSPGGSRAHLATIARQQCGRRLFVANDPTTDDCNAAATPTPTPTPVPPSGASCTVPGVTVVTDATGDQTGAPTTNQQLDIESISVAEQYPAGGPGQLVFTMKLNQLDPTTMTPNASWTTLFNATHADGTSTTYFVSADNNSLDNPAGLAFNYGFVDTTNQNLNTSVGAADSGAVDASKRTITIRLSVDKLKKPVAGTGGATLSGPVVDLSAGKSIVAVNGRTSLLVGALGTGLIETTDDTGTGEFTFAGAAVCGAGGGGTPTPTPSATPTPGGTSGPVVLHFHGNTDDSNGAVTCTGQGTVDVQGCGGPFLKTDAAGSTPVAAHWDSPDNVLDGSSAHNLYDPNWTWNSGPVRLGGDMTVEWWASCGACGVAGNADWTIRVWADNVKKFEQRVTATPSTPNVPELLRAKLFLPEIAAGSNVVLQIDPVFIDTQAKTHIFYDSQSACPAASGSAPCDSRVTMPVLAPGQPAPTPTPTPTPTPGATPPPAQIDPSLVPRFQTYAAPSPLGTSAGEPSLGVDWLTGKIMYIASLQALRVSFDDCTSPAKAKWEDKTAPNSKESLDAILFTDQKTGRTFVSQLTGQDSLAAYTDNDGDLWVPSQGGGIPSGVDHQTIGAGPYNANATAAPPAHPLYPNAVYYCSQELVTAFCARSDDGGLTFGPGVPIYTTNCGGIHGHVKVAPDGTVYVPNKTCGGKASLARSTDNGLTWTIQSVPDSSTSGFLVDPSVGIASDGTIYFGYQDQDRRAKLAVSHNRGDTWSPSVDVGAPLNLVNTTFPEVTAGDADRAAYAFIGTTVAGNYTDPATYPRSAAWHLYISTTYDGGASWTTVDATPTDPVQRGTICNLGTTACQNIQTTYGYNDRNLLDFMDITTDKQGRILVAYPDGCIGGCVNGTTNSYTALASIARQSGGLPLFRSASEPKGPTAPGNPPVAATSDANGVHLTWQAPDNGGSPITTYKVYRRAQGQTQKQLIASVGAATSFDDQTTAAGVTYYYTVTAVNAAGESQPCAGGEVTPTVVSTGDPCTSPGVSVATDPATDAAPPALDITELLVSEPYQSDGAGRLQFTTKVNSLAVVPPSSYWYVIWNYGTGARQFVRAKTDANGNFTFDYGTVGPALPIPPTSVPPSNTNAPTVGGAAAGTVDKTAGVITITVETSKVGGPKAGETLTSISPRTYGPTGGTNVISSSAIDTTASTPSYTLVGSYFCRANNAPNAVLSATPSTGTAPLAVNFDASRSSDPDAGDSIASYTFDFGDGTVATQSTPLVSHVYSVPGSYRATLVVKDSRGKRSVNVADAVITVQ